MGSRRYLRLLTMSSGRLLASFCPKLQNYPQHIQFYSNYHQLMFYGDNKASKIVF